MNTHKKPFPINQSPGKRLEDAERKNIGDTFDIGADNLRKLPKEKAFHSPDPNGGLGNKNESERDKESAEEERQLPDISIRNATDPIRKSKNPLFPDAIR